MHTLVHAHTLEHAQTPLHVCLHSCAHIQSHSHGMFPPVWLLIVSTWWPNRFGHGDVLVSSIWRILFALYCNYVFIPYNSLKTKVWVVVTLSKFSSCFLCVGIAIPTSQHGRMEGFHRMKVEEERALCGWYSRWLSPPVPSLWLCSHWTVWPAPPWLIWL